MSTPQSNATAGKGLAERLFKLTQHGTTVRTETIAGLTTFLTMVYIVFREPADPGCCGDG